MASAQGASGHKLRPSCGAEGLHLEGLIVDGKAQAWMGVGLEGGGGVLVR